MEWFIILCRSKTVLKSFVEPEGLRLVRSKSIVIWINGINSVLCWFHFVSLEMNEINFAYQKKRHCNMDLNLLSLLFMQARQYFKASNNSKMVFQITQKLNIVHIQLTIKMSLLLHMLKVWFLNSLKIIEYILCMLFFCLSARNNLTCKKHTVTLIWRQLRVLNPGKNLRCFLGMHCHFIL